jgi:polyadenylate-binding protein 2
MKARLQEMEDEANKLRDMQAKVEEEMNTIPGGAEANANREEADSRSIHVGGVDYACTPEELQMHFQSCGTVNRVTILTDKYENPKGFAYVEFLEADAVANALLLNDTEVHGRKIKVSAKRTNVPGMKAGSGGRGGGGARGWNPYGMMMPMMMPMPYMGRGRGRGRGRGGRGGGRGGGGRGGAAPY